VSSFGTFDLQFGWRGIRNLDLVGGVKNAFDREPSSSRNETGIQTGYDAVYGNPLGRQYYLRVRFKFW
jgi:iron complex outermembrane receptor protein